MIDEKIIEDIERKLTDIKSNNPEKWRKVVDFVCKEAGVDMSSEAYQSRVDQVEISDLHLWIMPDEIFNKLIELC